MQFVYRSPYPDTSSRQMSEADAVRAISVLEEVKLPAQARTALIMKRIGPLNDFLISYESDIMLSGNIAVEIMELLRIFKRNICVFAPASPNRGYKTLNGIQEKNGSPITPISNIQDLFKSTPLTIKVWERSFGLINQTIGLKDLALGDDYIYEFLQQLTFEEETKFLVIVDAETEEDLMILTKAMAKLGIVDRPILCGSKGVMPLLPTSFGVCHYPLKIFTIIVALTI